MAMCATAHPTAVTRNTPMEKFHLSSFASAARSFREALFTPSFEFLARDSLNSIQATRLSRFLTSFAYQHERGDSSKKNTKPTSVRICAAFTSSSFSYFQAWITAQRASSWPVRALRPSQRMRTSRKSTDSRRGNPGSVYPFFANAPGLTFALREHSGAPPRNQSFAPSLATCSFLVFRCTNRPVEPERSTSSSGSSHSVLAPVAASST